MDLVECLSRTEVCESVCVCVCVFIGRERKRIGKCVCMWVGG